VRARTAVFQKVAGRPGRGEQRRLEKLHPAHGAQILSRVAVSIEQDGRLLPRQLRNRREGGRRPGSLDDQLDAASARALLYRLRGIHFSWIDDLRAEASGQLPLARVGLHRQEQTLEAQHPPKILSEQQTSGAGPENQDGADRALATEAVTGHGAHQQLAGVNDTAQRLRQRRLLRGECPCDRYHVERGDDHVLRQSARQARDPVLRVELTLVRVAGLAVLATRRAARPDARSALVHHHTVTRPDISHPRANLLPHSGDLVPQYLGRLRKRNDTSAVVAVVVGVPRVDMHVGSAQSDGLHADPHLPGRQRRNGYVAHDQLPYVLEHGRLHRRGRTGAGDGEFALGHAVTRSVEGQARSRIVGQGEGPRNTRAAPAE